MGVEKSGFFLTAMLPGTRIVHVPEKFFGTAAFI